MAYISQKEAIDRGFITDSTLAYDLLTGDVLLDDNISKASVDERDAYKTTYEYDESKPFPTTFNLYIVYEDSKFVQDHPAHRRIEMGEPNPTYTFKESDLPLLYDHENNGYHYKSIGWVGSDNRLYKEGMSVTISNDYTLVLTPVWLSEDDPGCYFDFALPHKVM